ncbi:kinase-like domain-containing protein [Aspergillus undulatus]|uniref:kinase-like domain-containing protein n=1 Tax=Aspergillus undulatus TaxID=1810928 RepID=UPI003CCE1A73
MSRHDSPKLQPAQDSPTLVGPGELPGSGSIGELSETVSEAGSYQDDDLARVEVAETEMIKVGEGYAICGLFADNIESPLSYFEGGHFPVHLGDCLGPEWQYRVIHKLGTGGFANVWLCRVLGREPTEYVALKIVQAHLSGERSREVANLESVNGFHQCFVYPVAGPQVKDISRTLDDPHSYLRNFSRQAGEAMAALHRHGICHGDFRPSNILFRLEGLNGLSEKELLDVLGEPEGADILRSQNANEDICPPDYIVYPLEFDDRSICRLVSDKICVIDFGESFDMSTPPPAVGIPLHYASPELALDSVCGAASDIFALAATMYEIRFGDKLFDLARDDIDDYLYWMINQLGRLPEPQWSRWVDEWKRVQKERNMRRTGGDCQTDGDTTVLDDSHLDEATVRRATIRNQLSTKVFHLISLPGPSVCGWHEPLVEEERELLEDLFYGMTENDPEKRLSIEQVLQHPWFSYGVEKSPSAEDKPQPTDIEKPASPRSENSETVDIVGFQPVEDEQPQAPDVDETGSDDVEMSPVEDDTKSQSGLSKISEPEATPKTEPAVNELSVNEPAIIEQPRGHAVHDLEWPYGVQAVRFGVLAVSAWLCWAFGL